MTLPTVRRHRDCFAWLAIWLAVVTQSATAEEHTIVDGLSWNGDLRAGYFTQRHDDRDGSRDATDELAARLRLGLSGQITPALQANARIATRYSTYNNHPYFAVFDHIPDTDGLRSGDATVDLLSLAWTPSPKWLVEAGRIQTAFELAGIAGGSLDRSDSPNVDISWTNGVHARYHTDSGWNGHAILQYNALAGATNVRLPPLDFHDGGSRVTYFAALESEQHNGPVVQRALDVTYVPSSLQTDGTGTVGVKDYWAFVGRLAAEWPTGIGGMRFLAGTEIGYAPNTPTRAATGLAGTGDAGGTAWQVSGNLLDVAPGHSVGYQYGRAQAGWLISPDFRSNEVLHEVRYEWSMEQERALTVRYRYRQDLEIPPTAVERRHDQDLFVRYSIHF